MLQHTIMRRRETSKSLVCLLKSTVYILVEVICVFYTDNTSVLTTKYIIFNEIAAQRQLKAPRLAQAFRESVDLALILACFFAMMLTCTHPLQIRFYFSYTWEQLYLITAYKGSLLSRRKCLLFALLICIQNTTIFNSFISSVAIETSWKLFPIFKTGTYSTIRKQQAGYAGFHIGSQLKTS